MADDEDDLLARALGQQAAGALSDRSGRAAGAVARRLGKNVYETEMTLAAPFSEACAQVAGLLAAIGQVVAQTGPAGSQAVVRAIVGAGAMNLNPAILTVTMTSTADGRTTVHIRGAAKEGLIKQRAGEKAARRLAAMLGWRSLAAAGVRLAAAAA